jgi:hypothetical protein
VLSGLNRAIDKKEGIMRRIEKKSLIGVMVCSFFILFVMNTASFAQQENKVDPKLLDELIGGYTLKIQGQTGVFVFIAEEGELKGAPAGEEPSKLELVEGEDMIFKGHSSDGAEQLFKFLRNEEGKIAKCILSIPAAGLVVDMFKMEKLSKIILLECSDPYIQKGSPILRQPLLIR